MSKLVNQIVRKDKFVITEREDTGRIEFTRVSAVTGNRHRMYIAENRTDGRNWLRTHPEVDSALYTYIAPISMAESLKTEVYGTGPSVLFSPNVSNDKHGTPEERKTLTQEFTRHLQGKVAAALARAAAQHSDISTAGEMHGPHAGNTGEWGAEPGYSWNMFGGPLPRDAQEILTKEFTDEFKQDAAGIHDPNANTKELFYHTNKIKTMNGELPTNQKPVMKEAEEKTMEKADGILESMFLTGENNTLVGQSQVDYRNMLAGEIFGSAAFSTQRPHADTHMAVNTVMDTQASEGQGELRGIGAPSANMNEDTSFNQHMLTLAKNLFRAGRMDEAAKVVDAIENPAASANKVLEAAISTDGVVSARLTESLYQTAAFLNTLNEAAFVDGEAPEGSGASAGYAKGVKNDLHVGDDKNFVHVRPKKNEYGEFVVRMFKDGKHHEPADYFTDDWDDATATAREMHKHLGGA